MLFSKHIEEQMKVRSITPDEVELVINSADSVVVEDGLMVYQKVINTGGKAYLFRVFVNEIKQPPVAVTVYKTSNINKYI